MTNFKSLCLKAGAVVGGLALPVVALAQGSPFNRAINDVGTIGNKAGISTGSGVTLPVIIGNIINVALGFLGILLLVYMLYAGFLWMTSGGSDEGVKKAKTMLQNSIIGLVIIVAAYAISTFVLGSLVNVTR